MATTFTHVTLAQRVRFGRGLLAEHLEEEVGRLGCRRVMVVSTGREERDRPDLLDGIPVALRWTEVRRHVPVAEAERARQAARAAGADLLLALGGGSAVGLAKAVALSDGIPVIAVPTTYAGSESTDVWGLTEGGTKTTGTDPAVLPVAVVYDPALTDRMPTDLAVASGLNALAHCVDALWAPRADPVNRALALEGARLLAAGLRAVAAGTPGEVRDGTLLGAHLAAVAFASSGAGLHHKVCHVLGGTYDLPHATTHAVVLPYVLALNGPAVPDAAARLADALGTSTQPAGGPEPAVRALDALRADLGAPTALRDHGLAERDLADATDRCLAVVPPSNPVAVTREAMTRLLRAAWAGTPATTPAS